MLTIYHYSDKLLSEILTKQKQEEEGIIQVDAKERKEKEARSTIYNHFYSSLNQISFFFDPIPFDLVSKELYNNPMYQKGNIIYEHRVNVENINIRAWQVEESPIKTSMLDSWTEYDKENWADNVTLLEDIYGDRGRDIKGLTRAILRYKGKTRFFYEQAFKNPNFTEYNRGQYAAMVPHLYLYPIEGVILPYSVKKILI